MRFGVFRPQDAEPADPVPEIRRVAEANMPDEPAYGQCAWNADRKTVYYVAWDGQPYKPLRAAFMAIPGVKEFECDYESPPVGWFDATPLWPDKMPLWLLDHPREATLDDLVQLAAMPLYAEQFDFNPDQERDEKGMWVDEGKSGSKAPGDKAKGEGTGESDTGGGWNTMADIGDQQHYDDLKEHWANLDQKLSKYEGDPNNPKAQALIQKQIDTVQEMHAINLDKGTAPGIGEPGGPRDVVVVGAGPAGLQAGINGGSEGLDTLLVDQSNQPGGQIGMTSRTENVLGFPAGTTGDALGQAGLEQAQRLGADTKLGVGVTDLAYDKDTGMKTVVFSDGSSVDTRSVIIAGGVQFNQLQFPGSDAKGVVYGDGQALKDIGGPTVIVGGANSAGQAAVYAAGDTGGKAQDVTMLVRGDSLDTSDYLSSQIDSNKNIDVRTGSEIAQANTDDKGNIQSVTLKDGTEIPANSVGVFVGSSPRTDWADGVDKAPNGSILTGQNGHGVLETNIPGVFAAGDVRDGSMHRVVSAAGEGGTALADAFQYVNRTFGGQGSSATASLIADALKVKSGGRPGDDFLMKMVELDNRQPFTGYDPDAPVVVPHRSTHSVTISRFRR